MTCVICSQVWTERNPRRAGSKAKSIDNMTVEVKLDFMLCGFANLKCNFVVLRLLGFEFAAVCNVSQRSLPVSVVVIRVLPVCFL